MPFFPGSRLIKITEESYFASPFLCLETHLGKVKWFVHWYPVYKWNGPYLSQVLLVSDINLHSPLKQNDYPTCSCEHLCFVSPQNTWWTQILSLHIWDLVLKPEPWTEVRTMIQWPIVGLKLATLKGTRFSLMASLSLPLLQNPPHFLSMHLSSWIISHTQPEKVDYHEASRADGSSNTASELLWECPLFPLYPENWWNKF